MAINGQTLAYVDSGTGRPVDFLHGNPTSSFLWRGVLPHVETANRVIAPDMFGMGDSDTPDLAYTYADHARYLHGLLDALDLSGAVLVLHDWGGALGFDRAMQNPERVAAIAYMETITRPVMPFESYEAMGPIGELFQAWRTPGVGEKMILEDNMFIDEILGKMAVGTPLSPDVLAAYNGYYPDAGNRAPVRPERRKELHPGEDHRLCPERRLAIDIYNGTMPLKRAVATVEMRPLSARRTEMTFAMEFTPKFGLLGKLMVPLMKPRFRKLLGNLMDGNKAYLENGTTIVRAA